MGHAANPLYEGPFDWTLFDTNNGMFVCLLNTQQKYICRFRGFAAKHEREPTLLIGCRDWGNSKFCIFKFGEVFSLSKVVFWGVSWVSGVVS